MDQLLPNPLDILVLCFMNFTLGFRYFFQLLDERLPLFQLPLLTATRR